MKRVALATAALAGRRCCFDCDSRCRPPASPCPPADDPTVVPGVFHVHTNRSDGRSSPEDDRRRGRARRPQVHHLHRPRRRHREARCRPVVSRGRPLHRRRRDQHARRPLRRARPAGGAVPARRRSARRRSRMSAGSAVSASSRTPIRRRTICAGSEWNAPFDAIELVNLDSGWRTRVQETGWRIAGHRARHLSVPAVGNDRPSGWRIDAWRSHAGNR